MAQNVYLHCMGQGERRTPIKCNQNHTELMHTWEKSTQFKKCLPAPRYIHTCKFVNRRQVDIYREASLRVRVLCVCTCVEMSRFCTGRLCSKFRMECKSCRMEYKSSPDVVIIEFVCKSLLGSSARYWDIPVELRIAGVIRWSLKQNWGRVWKNVILFHRHHDVAIRFIMSVGVWYVWCELGCGYIYKFHDSDIRDCRGAKSSCLVTNRTCSYPFHACIVQTPTDDCFVRHGCADEIQDHEKFENK